MSEIGYYNVSRQIYDAALDCLADERGVHAETAVAAISAICGEELFLSRGTDGIESEQAAGSHILRHLQDLLDELLVEHSEDWSAPVPAVHAPHADPAILAEQLRPHLKKHYEEHGLNDEQAASASCLALAFVIRDCQAVLPASVSVLIANDVLRNTLRKSGAMKGEVQHPEAQLGKDAALVEPVEARVEPVEALDASLCVPV